MPDTNHFTGLPVPVEGEAADGPEAFLNFRTALAGHTVLFATSAANRDSLYADAPVGSLCASSTESTVWLKTALPNNWIELYSDTGWVSLASAAWGANYIDNGSFYRRVGNHVSLVINCIYQGSDYDTGANGNVSDDTIVTIPESIRYNVILKRLMGVYSISGLTGSFRLATGGAMVLMTVTSNTTITNGMILQGNLEYTL